MYSEITTVGKLTSLIKDPTNKHKLQSTWKNVMLVIDGDMFNMSCQNRYNLTLIDQYRHISFINDN
jgi:hypothetical protein